VIMTARNVDDGGADAEDRQEADPLQRVSHAVTPVRLGRPDLHRDDVEEREGRDLDPRDEHGHPSRGAVLERDQATGDENGDETRGVLRLDERLEDSGGRVDTQVVEDREIEDQKRQQGAGQAEQQPRGPPDRRAVPLHDLLAAKALGIAHRRDRCAPGLAAAHRRAHVFEVALTEVVELRIAMPEERTDVPVVVADRPVLIEVDLGRRTRDLHGIAERGGPRSSTG
jgi:hypothetical protein